MKLKFCSCHQCRRGRKSKFQQSIIKGMVGGQKRKAKVILAKTDPDEIDFIIPISVPIGYTD